MSPAVVSTRSVARLSPVLRSILPHPLAPPRPISTSRKSVVLIIDTVEGQLVAKSASPEGLRCDRWVYDTLLPAIDLVGPSVRGWVETPLEAWLVMDYQPGRRPAVGDQADISRVSVWAARLHSRSRGTTLFPPDCLPRPVPEARMAALELALRRQPEVTNEALEACGEVERALPLVREAAALPECITHADLSDWNLLLTSSDVIALDWERVSYRSPSIDLAICDVGAYIDELHRLGEFADPVSLMRAHLAGIVLTTLAHDLVRKSARVQLRYLRRITTAVRALQACS